MPSYQMIGNTAAQQPTETVNPIYTDRQLEILALLKQHKALSPDELYSLMASRPAARTLREELVRMKELGLIDAIGKTKARKWFLKS